MKAKCAKQKSRRLQDHVCALVRAIFFLSDLDVWPAIMGEGGLDIRLTRYAREYFPFALECKNREKLNIWEGLEQAETIAAKEGLHPVLIFKRNHTPTYAALSLELFERLVGTARPGSGIWPSAFSVPRARASIWTALKEAELEAKKEKNKMALRIRKGDGPAYVVLPLLEFLGLTAASCPALEPPVPHGFEARITRGPDDAARSSSLDPIEEYGGAPSST